MKNQSLKNKKKSHHSIIKNKKNLIKNFVQKIKNKELLKKILYTLLIILIFRIAATISMPGVNVDKNFANNEGSIIGILNLMGGGALSNFSIVALGISPYITASIIMQLLQSEIFPPLYRLSQSGPMGKRKINVITRCITLVFAFIQAITIIQSFQNFVHINPLFNKTWFKYVILPIILIAGSLFVLFLGEQITNNGIGNGTSLIIFSGIAVRIPSKFQYAYLNLIDKKDASSNFLGIIEMFLYIIVFLFLIYIIGFFYKSERHIPIQQTGSGMANDLKQMSKLPIKLNPSGVLPIIFALTIAMIPLTIVSFFDPQNLTRQWIEHNMNLTSPLGLSIFVLVIFLFTIIMSLLVFNPTRIAENFAKNGTFIPGIRPGEETESYLIGVIFRLSLFSAIYLSFISIIQYVEQIIGLETIMTFSGTSLIILVTVAIETINQLKARDRTRKISLTKEKKYAKNNKKGLLW